MRGGSGERMEAYGTRRGYAGCVQEKRVSTPGPLGGFDRFLPDILIIIDLKDIYNMAVDKK